MLLTICLKTLAAIGLLAAHATATAIPGGNGDGLAHLRKSFLPARGPECIGPNCAIAAARRAAPLEPPTRVRARTGPSPLPTRLPPPLSNFQDTCCAPTLDFSYPLAVAPVLSATCWNVAHNHEYAAQLSLVPCLSLSAADALQCQPPAVADSNIFDRFCRACTFDTPTLALTCTCNGVTSSVKLSECVGNNNGALSCGASVVVPVPS